MLKRNLTVRKKHTLNNKKRKKYTIKTKYDPYDLYSNYLRLGINEEPKLEPLLFNPAYTNISNEKHTLFESNNNDKNDKYNKKWCKENMSPLEKIIRISKKILLQIIHRSTYSLLPYYFMKSDIPINMQDDYVSNFNSGNCVFFAKKVLKELRKNGIYGYLIPATTLKHLMQPGFPDFCHCVVLVKSGDNLIIYEPAFYILDPIVISIDGKPTPYKVEVYEKEWLYSYNKETNRINVTDNDSNPLLYYSIMKILNPTTAISYPVNIYNKRIPLVKYDAYKNKKQAHLSIRLDTKCLEGFYDSNTDNSIQVENDGWFPKLYYEDLLNQSISDNEKKKKIGEWPGLSSSVCNSLLCSKRNLIDKVYYIIKYHHKNI